MSGKREGSWALGERSAPRGAAALGARRRARRRVIRRRRAVAAAGALLLIVLVIVVWPSGRSAVAVHRETKPSPRAPVPAVLASDPPLDGGPVAPTQAVELKTSTEQGVELDQAVVDPPVPGRWRWCATDLACFEPSAAYPMGAHEVVRVPLVLPGTEHGRVRRRWFQLAFSVVPGESVGLAQYLLAQLGYLPVRPSRTLQPVPGSSGDSRAGGAGTPASSGTASAAAGQALAASLVWRWPGVPSAVRALWTPGSAGVMTAGAVIQFDRVQGLTSGSYPPYQAKLTPAFWRALFAAALAGRRDPDDYAVAMVSEQRPETLVLWSDGQDALETLVNTGIPGGATPVGAWPVYLRYPEQTMRGYTVSGKPYVYPDVRDVNYFTGNIAIHAFPRARYGFPQSQGCVEVPPTVAPEIYALLHYGSLVIVRAA